MDLIHRVRIVRRIAFCMGLLLLAVAGAASAQDTQILLCPSTRNPNLGSNVSCGGSALQSFAFGVTQPAVTPGAGISPGHAVNAPLLVRKYLDANSAAFVDAPKYGTSSANALGSNISIGVNKITPAGNQNLTIVLNSPWVESVAMVFDGFSLDNRMVEAIALGYKSLTIYDNVTGLSTTLGVSQ